MPLVWSLTFLRGPPGPLRTPGPRLQLPSGMSDFKSKMFQIQFRLGLRPDPAGGAYSAPPDPLAGFKGPTYKGREGGKEKEGRGGGEEGNGMGGKEKEGRVGAGGRGRDGMGGERKEDVEGPGKWSAPGPVLALGGPGHGDTF